MPAVLALAMTLVTGTAALAGEQDALFGAESQNSIFISGLGVEALAITAPDKSIIAEPGTLILQGDLAQKLALRDDQTGNRLLVVQSGAGHQARLSVQGADNSIQILQGGLRNFAQITQSGVMNSVSIQQGAW
ncbi:MAG: hypothetical protein ACU0A4_15000 [Paracoccaceae bacterium]